MKNKKKIHLMSWKKMSIAKAKRRLGFQDLVYFNIALLAKQSWRIMQNPESLAVKIISEKYFHQGSFMSAKLKNRPSFAWRSILAGREQFQEGIFGGLVMGVLCQFDEINGSQGRQHSQFSLHA